MEPQAEFPLFSPEIFDMISCNFSRLDYTHLYEAQVTPFMQYSSLIFERSLLGDIFEEAKKKGMEDFTPRTFEILRLDSVLKKGLNGYFRQFHGGILEKTAYSYQSTTGTFTSKGLKTVFQRTKSPRQENATMMEVKIDLDLLEKVMPFWSWNVFAPRVHLKIRGCFEATPEIKERLADREEGGRTWLEKLLPISVDSRRQFYKDPNDPNREMTNSTTGQTSRAFIEILNVKFGKEDEAVDVGGKKKMLRRFQAEIIEDNAERNTNKYAFAGADHHLKLTFDCFTLITKINMRFVPRGYCKSDVME